MSLAAASMAFRHAPLRGLHLGRTASAMPNPWLALGIPAASSSFNSYIPAHRGLQAVPTGAPVQLLSPARRLQALAGPSESMHSVTFTSILGPSNPWPDTVPPRPYTPLLRNGLGFASSAAPSAGLIRLRPPGFLATSQPSAPASAPSSGAAKASSATAVATKEQGALPWHKRVWKTIVHEAVYYYEGFRLFGKELVVALKLCWQVLHGHTMTRRERNQLKRTMIDLFRMVPFSIMIIIPFMEFLLPVALKIFPGLLPSTFKTEDQASKMRRHLKAHLEMTKFLQELGSGLARRVEARGGESASMARSFRKFIDKVKLGEPISAREISKYTPLFEDELTIDRLSHKNLVLLCKYIGLIQYGPTPLLKYMIRSQIRFIQQDDELIQQEGGPAQLTHKELMIAAKDRGIRVAADSTTDELRASLSRWLKLSLKYEIPHVLLLLARALIFESGQTIKSTKDALAASIVSLSDETVEAAATAAESEKGLDTTENIRARRKLLESEDAEISEEEEQRAKFTSAQGDGVPAEKDAEHPVVAPAATAEPAVATAAADAVMVPRTAAVEAPKAKVIDTPAVVASAGATTADAAPVSASEPEAPAAPTVPPIPAKVMQAIVDAVQATSGDSMVSAELAEIEQLKRQLAARSESDTDAVQATDGPGAPADSAEDAEDRKRPMDALRKKLDRRVEKMISQLENQVELVNATLGDQYHLIDSDRDGKFDLSELTEVVDVLDHKFHVPAKAIKELVHTIDVDRDGRVSLADLREALFDSIRHETRADAFHATHLVLTIAEHLAGGLQVDKEATKHAEPSKPTPEASQDTASPTTPATKAEAPASESDIELDIDLDRDAKTDEKAAEGADQAASSTKPASSS